MDWCKVYLFGTRQGQEVDYSEHGKGTSGSIKWEKFLDWLQTSSLSRLCSVMSNYSLKHTKLNRISYGRLWRLDIISAVTLRSLVVPTVKSEKPPAYIFIYTLKMGAGCSFQTTVLNYVTTWRHITDYSTLHLVLTTSRICDLTLGPAVVRNQLLNTLRMG